MRNNLVHVAATLSQILTVVFWEVIAVNPCREMDGMDGEGGEESWPPLAREDSEDGSIRKDETVPGASSQEVMHFAFSCVTVTV